MSYQKGGRRVLQITPDSIVEFLKRHSDMARTYTVDHHLPDDAHIVDGRIAWGRGGFIEIVLESAEWQDGSVDGLERLSPGPLVAVQYLEPAAKESRAVDVPSKCATEPDLKMPRMLAGQMGMCERSANGMDRYDDPLTAEEEADIRLWQVTQATNPALALLLKDALMRRYEHHIKYGIAGPKRIYELGLL